MKHTISIKQADTLTKVAHQQGARIINKYVGPLPQRVEYKFVKEGK